MDFKWLPASFRTGISFGLTSGTITTLGLMTGLSAATNSKVAVIGGVLTIAVADAFSDALGIHISEESKNVGTRKVWESTTATFFTKMIYALTFLLPITLLDFPLALYIAIAYGLGVLCLLSYAVAVADKENPENVILEHVGIAILVILVTHYLGEFIARAFGA